MIKRDLTEVIEKVFFKKKAVIVIGARQTGKTTLVRDILDSRLEKVVYFNGDESDTNDIFSSYTITGLKNIIGNHEIIFFDEAQRINNIGLIIKLIVDHFEKIPSLSRHGPDQQRRSGHAIKRLRSKRSLVFAPQANADNTDPLNKSGSAGAIFSQPIAHSHP